MAALVNRYYPSVVSLINKIVPSMPIKTIAIVGGSGAGKTFLANKLKDEFRDAADIIRLDNFYRDLSCLEFSEREKTNFDDPSAIDWEEFRTVLETIMSGKDALLPLYDFCSHTRKQERFLFRTKPLVIFEGLWLIHEEWLRELFCFSIFVESSKEVRLDRRIARDVSERGRTVESVIAQFTAHVSPMHDKFVEPQKQFADFILTSPWSDKEWNQLISTIKNKFGL